MPTTRKNRSPLRQTDSNRTSAAIERHLLGLGATGALYRNLGHCDQTRGGSPAMPCRKQDRNHAGSASTREFLPIAERWRRC